MIAATVFYYSLITLFHADDVFSLLLKSWCLFTGVVRRKYINILQKYVSSVIYQFSVVTFPCIWYELSYKKWVESAEAMQRSGLNLYRPFCRHDKPHSCRNFVRQVQWVVVCMTSVGLTLNISQLFFLRLQIIFWGTHWSNL